MGLAMNDRRILLLVSPVFLLVLWAVATKVTQ